METMSKVRIGEGKYTILEDTHRVTHFRRYLPAGAPGGNRQKPLIQFIAAEGGCRTVAEGDIVGIK